MCTVHACVVYMGLHSCGRPSTSCHDHCLAAQIQIQTLTQTPTPTPTQTQTQIRVCTRRDGARVSLLSCVATCHACISQPFGPWGSHGAPVLLFQKEPPFVLTFTVPLLPLPLPPVAPVPALREADDEEDDCCCCCCCCFLVTRSAFERASHPNCRIQHAP